MATKEQIKQALASGAKPFRLARYEFEREYVDFVLKAAHGNVSLAALLADKDRKDFYDLMRRANVDPEDYR